jgi:hypothetical protein
MGVDTIAVLSQWWAQESFFIRAHPFNPRLSASKKLFASSAANQGRRFGDVGFGDIF